ncbi:MAG: TetR family transcriptional regulator [Nitrospirales bacterium]|nr:TetR family transcriptional regulator [Nitrospirales bacterium]
MAQTKNHLKSIATRTIQEKGVNGLSFRDLAAEANIKSSSVHYYFPQKADLIYEVTKEYTDAFFQALHKIDQLSKHSVERLDALLDLYKKNLPGRFCLCGMLAAESNQLDNKTKDLLSRFFVKTQKWLREVIEDLPSNGATPAGLSSVLLSSLEGALLMDGVKGKEKYLTEVQKFIRGLV